MSKSLLAACLVAVLAGGGAVALGLAGGDVSDGREAGKTSAGGAKEAVQYSDSAPGAPPKPGARPQAATAARGGAEAPLPTIPLPADSEQAGKVAALNQVVAEVTTEAMKRPAQQRMTQEEISELIRTRIRGVIPDQDAKGASQGDS